VSPRLLALLIAGAALSAGCGQAAVKSSSQAKPKPSQNQGLIAESAAATADAGTARAAYTMKMTGLAGASGGVTATGTGAVDFASRSTELQLHMTVPQAGMTVDMSERMVGTTLYMHSPLLSGTTGKPWIKLDLQKLGKSEGLDMNSAMSTGGSDPTQMLSYLNAASDSIDRVGMQVVRVSPTYDGFSYRTLAATSSPGFAAKRFIASPSAPGVTVPEARKLPIVQSFHITGKR